MPEIDIILYHGDLLKNANANKGLSFERPGIETYYHRLKTLDELKMIVMEEMCANHVVHNIQITYRMPHEVLKHRINYKYMAIETDKHVKIMFDKLERIPAVNGIELYIQLEPRAKVSIEEIQQITTSLQVTIPDAQYEYSTQVEDDDVYADDDDKSDDDDYVDQTTAINGEDFVDRDKFKRGTMMTMRQVGALLARCNLPRRGEG